LKDVKKENLAPCPFAVCGCADIICNVDPLSPVTTWSTTPQYYYFCEQCLAQGPTRDTREEARAAWGLRAPAAAAETYPTCPAIVIKTEAPDKFSPP